MIEKLKQMLGSTLGEQTDAMLADREQSKLLAAVALMVEIIAVDDEQHDTEKAMLRHILSSRFNTSEHHAEQLIEQAEQAHEDSTDFFRFTSEINREFSAREKIDLIESLWQLAWADEHIHELEQHVIRRLANLLHVSHKDFIATKLRVTGH